MTTVIVQQPGVMQGQGYRQNITQWTSGIWGCFDDCGSCVFAYFCFPCYVCNQANKMNENCACCMAFCLGELGVMAMRTRVRTAFGIQGSICEDFCCAAYCPQLAACQVGRELKARGTTCF